jgi:hypothetical protein
MPNYQPSHCHKQVNVSGYCKVSVLVNHFHASSHRSWQLFPHALHSWWSIGLTCDVNKYLNFEMILVGAHGLLVKSQTKEELLQRIWPSADHIQLFNWSNHCLLGAFYSCCFSCSVNAMQVCKRASWLPVQWRARLKVVSMIWSRCWVMDVQQFLDMKLHQWIYHTETIMSLIWSDDWWADIFGKLYQNSICSWFTTVTYN